MRLSGFLILLLLIGSDLALAQPIWKEKEYTSWEEALMEPEKVKVLSINDASTSFRFPKEMALLSNLKILEISAPNTNVVIPDAIGSLQNLHLLSIEGQVKSLPKSLSGLEKLVVLKIRSGVLEKVDFPIFKLAQLKTLILEKCNNQKLLNRICKDLEKKPTPISFFLEGTGTKGATHDASSIRLASPQSCLVVISSHGLVVPKKLYDVEQTENLILRNVNGDFVDLPKLTQLQHLSIDSSNLASLPALHSLKELRYFNVSHTQLSTLPSGVLALPKLDDLILRQNNLQSLPNDLCESGQGVLIVLDQPQLKPYPDCVRPTGLFNKGYALEDFELDTDLSVEPPFSPERTEEPQRSEEVFVVVEAMPVPKEGILAFRQWVMNNIDLPEVCAELNGRVFVQFIVDTNGTLNHIEILPGTENRNADCLNKEAIRVIGSSPAWNPGTQRGIAVRVKYIFPVEFN